MDGFREKKVEKKDDQVKDFFLQDKIREEKEIREDEEGRRIDYETERKIIAKHAKNALHHWKAPEFEVCEQDRRWYLYLALILMAIIAYAIYANSPIMAITFILIGLVGYTYIDKEPRTLDFMITHDGIIAGKEIFEYERIKSFWIFYEEDGSKVISLHMRSLITPYMHIPIGEENPLKIREALLENIEEIKQEHNIVETLERLFRI
ncbi:MAG TPA: hypothetical protein DIC35_02705 [Candidatus Moranbacteria bacterium]|nr:hypothetical protein [Candidatus Moranbacteria bacterium]